MLKADFHVHTVLSKHHLLDRIKLADALNTPAEMVKAAADKGLDCIAIAEHNLLFNPYSAKKLTKAYGIVVLPGVELYLNKKDVIAIGITKLPKVETVAEFKDVVHGQDGILVAPHPYDPLNRGFKEFDLVDAIEVVNGFGAFGFKKLITLADKLKKAKICGSDAHCTNQLGWTHFFIDAEPDADAIIAAVKKRKTVPVYAKTPIHVQFEYYFKKYVFGEAIFKPAFRRL